MKTSAKQAPQWETWVPLLVLVPSPEIRSQSEEVVVPDELQEGYPVAVEEASGLPPASHIPQHSAPAIPQDASWATNPLFALPHLASALPELRRHRPELG